MLYLTLSVYCFKCHRHLGFKADDGEGTGPIYCEPCARTERIEREADAEHRAKYQQARSR